MERFPRTYGNTLITVTATPTLDTSVYASGDVLHTANIQFNVGAHVGGTGYIVGLNVVDKDAQGSAGELWLFSAPLAGSYTANAAWALSDADAALCVGVIPFGSYFLGGTAGTLNQVSVNGTVRQAFTCGAQTTLLYGRLVTRGTPTYTASGLIVNLFIERVD